MIEILCWVVGGLVVSWVFINIMSYFFYMAILAGIEPYIKRDDAAGERQQESK
jgi:uncharacterized ion transporter superfamily protein YfcC